MGIKKFQVISRTTNGDTDSIDELAEWAETIPLNESVDHGAILARDFKDIAHEFPHFSFSAEIESEFSYVYEIQEDDEDGEIETFVECNWIISSEVNSLNELGLFLSRAFPNVDFTLLFNE